jgi:vacuolar-type H+-ATPase subunit E/Vma4
MFQRLGNTDLPHSIRKQLQDVKQNVEASIEELTERVQEMATDGYNKATEDFVELMAVDAFLKGCNDKKAGLATMDKNPSRIDQAL